MPAHGGATSEVSPGGTGSSLPGPTAHQAETAWSGSSQVPFRENPTSPTCRGCAWPTGGSELRRCSPVSLWTLRQVPADGQPQAPRRRDRFDARLADGHCQALAGLGVETLHVTVASQGRSGDRPDRPRRAGGETRSASRRPEHTSQNGLRAEGWEDMLPRRGSPADAQAFRQAGLWGVLEAARSSRSLLDSVAVGGSSKVLAPERTEEPGPRGPASSTPQPRDHASGKVPKPGAYQPVVDLAEWRLESPDRWDSP
jgi:hypothetical protein